MATVTLQSFNVFLAERLSAAALDIYGFVEQTLTDYQEEVNRAKLENQRLQRLLDLVYKPEIRLHKEDSRQTNLSTWNLELCVQEKQIQTECFPKEEPEDTYTLTPVVPVEENEENQMPQRLTKVEKGGEHGDYEAPHDPTQVITDGEQSQHEEKSQHEAAPPPPPPFPGFTKNKKTFNCNICSQTFRKRAKANLHLAVHEANGSLKPVSTGLICIDCGKRTKTKSKMITHMRAHAQNNSFPCSICGKIYKCKSNMKEHLQTHTVERLYSCDICGKHFKRSTTLSKHVQVKHRENTVFKCTQCSQCFAVVPELKKHIRKAHSNAKPPTPSTEEIHPTRSPSGHHDEPGPSSVKDEEQWINGCEEQPSAEESDDEDALTKELIKTVQQLEDCRAAEERQEPAQRGEEDPEPSEEKTSTTLYRCHICNYIFTKKTVLTWHLKTHESKSHDGRGNFDCHICGKQIPCQSNLQNHMRVHTGERPYSCHFCGKCFKLKGHMTEHIRTHTGEKPFSCHICGKSFNRGSTLRKHVLAKHKEERPYKCEDCDELFTERPLMKTHMRKVHGVKLSASLTTP